jgi:hypothetical protein
MSQVHTIIEEREFVCIRHDLETVWQTFRHSNSDEAKGWPEPSLISIQRADLLMPISLGLERAPFLLVRIAVVTQRYIEREAIGVVGVIWHESRIAVLHHTQWTYVLALSMCFRSRIERCAEELGVHEALDSPGSLSTYFT